MLKLGDPILDRNRSIDSYPDQYYDHDTKIVVVDSILCEAGTGILIHLESDEVIYELVKFKIPLVYGCAEVPDPTIPFA